MSTPAEQANIVRGYLCDADLQKSLRTSITLFNLSRQSRLSLRRYADSELMESECEVAVPEDPMRAVLVDVQDTSKERTVEICGVLVDCKLPPWTSANRLFEGMANKKGIPVNSVDIAFFDHETFQPTCHGLENVARLFGCAVGSVDSVPYVDAMGIKSIRCENRLGTPSSAVPLGVFDLPVPNAIDPKGIMARQVLSKGRLRYTEDNEVMFYRAQNVTGSFDELTVIPASPHEIMPGMVVNVQATPVLVPTKRGTPKINLKLRSVMIVCNKTFKLAMFKTPTMMRQQDKPLPVLALKRSAGYDLPAAKRMRQGPLDDPAPRTRERDGSEERDLSVERDNANRLAGLTLVEKETQK